VPLLPGRNDHLSLRAAFADIKRGKAVHEKRFFPFQVEFLGLK
jgi:hypothetical protein